MGIAMSNTELTTCLTLLSSELPDEIRDGAHRAGDGRFTEAIPSLVRHVASSNIGVQEAADRALRRIGGAEVVEAVIPLLRSENVPERNVGMDILRSQGAFNIEAIAALLSDEDVDVRIFASDILGSVANSVAVPYLGRALLDDPEVNVRYQAAVSLGELGLQEGIPYLNKALNDEEWVQFSVIEALTKIRDESSVAALVYALDKSSDLVSSMVIDALGELGNIKAVPLLLKRLDESPAVLSNKIVRAIINILGDKSVCLIGGKENKRMLGYMESAIRDEDPDIQDAAVRGFAAIGSDVGSRHIIELAATLDPDQDTERLYFLIDTLVSIGYNDAVAYQFVNGSKEQQRVALEALGRIGDGRSVPLLKEEFPRKELEMQRVIIAFLADMAQQDDEEFFIWVAQTHRDGNILRIAVEFLGNKGTPERAEPIVLELLEHKYNDVKESAMNAAIALQTPLICDYMVTACGSEEPIQRLIGIFSLGYIDVVAYKDLILAGLEDEQAFVRKAAVEALGRQEFLTDDDIDRIMIGTYDENPEIRMSSIDLLGLIDRESMEKVLIERLRDEDDWVRVRAAEHLGDRGSKAAVESLVNALTADNSLLVISAINALAKIGGNAAFRALLSVLNHPEHEVQAAAEEAVAVISNQGEA